MKTTAFLSAALAASLAFLSGCINPAALMFSQDQELMQQRHQLTMKFQNNPDTDAWHDARQKLAASLGDRIFEQDFARVFDSLSLAAADLELKINNMERQSGYIAASGMTLPPSDARLLRKEAVNDWCRVNGFDPSILDRKFKTNQFATMSDMMDFSGMMAKYEKMQKGLTFQLVKMGDGKTKVKLRFSDIYYPGEVEQYYKLIWQAVDKQIFVDRNIEGKVEQRQ